MSDFKERLKEIRKLKGLKQNELAELTKITQPFISQLETGKSQASVETISDIAKVLGVSVDCLLGHCKETKKALEPTERPEGKNTSNGNILNGKIIQVPVYEESEICCGKGFIGDSEAEELTPSYYEPFTRPVVGQGSSNKIVGILARGNSMIGSGIKDGSIVYIALNTEIFNGQPAAIYVGIERHFMLRCVIHKNDGSVILRAKNPDYPDEILTKEDIDAGNYIEIGPIIRYSDKPEWA